MQLPGCEAWHCLFATVSCGAGMLLCVYVHLGRDEVGERGHVCLSLVVFCSWGSAVGQARLEDVPHVASRDGPLLPEGREGVHGPDRQGREGPRMVQRVGN